MRLTFEQIKSVTFGATSIEERDGAITFHRFSEEVEEIYSRLAPEKHGAARATTGIVLDFVTDSKSISFVTFNGIEGETRYFIDIYEDDLLVHSFHPSKDRTPATISLKDGESRVRIYLDSHSCCRIEYVELDDGATLAPSKKGKRALVFGDSITQGARCNHTSLSYANAMVEHFGWNATSFAIGGDIFREWIPGTVSLCTPDIITVAYGTNDWHSRPRDVIENACRGFFDRIRDLYPEARLFYISPIWRRGYKDTVPAGDFFETADMMDSIARAHGAEIICGYDIVPHMEEFFDDGLHPNDLGQCVYAKAVIRELESRGVTK